jgi:hypothetical protein
MPMQATLARAGPSDSGGRRLLRFMQHLCSALETRARSLAFEEQAETLAELPTEREPRRRIAQPADGKLRMDSPPTVRQPPKEGRPNPTVALERDLPALRKAKQAIQRKLQTQTGPRP